MFAYGHKYLDGKGELFLIYPCNENFGLKDKKLVFDFTPTPPNDQKLILYIVPCDWQQSAQTVFPDWFKQALLPKQPATLGYGG